MKIDVLTLKKLIWIVYEKYFNYQQIVLKDVQIEISDVLRINLLLDYYHVETKIQAIGKVFIDNDIIVDLEGKIQYGFIQFDFYKILEEYLKEFPFISIKGKQLRIKNEYLKDIHLDQNCIELELL